MAVCLSSLVTYRCACCYGLWAQVVAEPIDDIVYDGLLEPMVVAMVCLVEHDILHLRPILAEGLVEMVALSLRHHVVVVAVHDEEWGKSGMDVAQRTGGTRLVGYLLQEVARIAAIDHAIDEQGLAGSPRVVVGLHLGREALVDGLQVGRTEDGAAGLHVGALVQILSLVEARLVHRRRNHRRQVAASAIAHHAKARLVNTKLFGIGLEKADGLLAVLQEGREGVGDRTILHGSHDKACTRQSHATFDKLAVVARRETATREIDHTGLRLIGSWNDERHVEGDRSLLVVLRVDDVIDHSQGRPRHGDIHQDLLAFTILIVHVFSRYGCLA